MTERDAVAAGVPIRVARKNVSEIATMPPRILGETRGLIKFVIDAESDELLGASLFCIDSQELVNLVALAIRQHITAAEQQRHADRHGEPPKPRLLSALLSARDGCVGGLPQPPRPCRQCHQQVAHLAHHFLIGKVASVIELVSRKVDQHLGQG